MMALPDSAFAIDPATGKLAGFSPVAPATPGGAQPAPASSTPASSPTEANVRVNEGMPTPEWVDPGRLAAAIAKKDAKDQALVAELQSPPKSASEFRMPSPPFGMEAVPVEHVANLQQAALDVGLTKGEFSTVAHMVYLHAGSPQSTTVDKRLARIQANSMAADLESRHGVAGAEALARQAVAAVELARAKAPQVADALRQMIRTNRPLLEMLAKVGARRAKR